MSTSNKFDATASALGYIYQVRYALLLAYEKITEVDNPDDCFISIEKLDDIAFEEGDDPTELLQAKYHGTPGNITDRSEDLWKTIRVWAELLVEPGANLEGATFTLLTTQTAISESIASHLGTDPNVRDVQAAVGEMRNIAKETSNATNKKAYEAFSALEPWQQEGLLARVYIIGNSPDIVGVEEKIKRKTRLAVSEHHVEAFTTRLEGAWFKKVIEVMSSSNQHAISVGELVSIHDDLRTQFLPGNLPADFDDIEPDDIDIENDDRTFINQLRIIGANNRIIRNAIINYYRAYEQRSRWSRDNLVRPGEIQKYLNRLKQEWEHHSSLIEAAHDISNEEGKRASGTKLYSVCQTEAALPIRPEFKSAYVARGSYHALADTKDIGWHPDYLAKLVSANDKGVG